MKGQMIIEFIIAAVMFFGVILFTINYLNTEVSVYSSDYFINEVESKSVQVSEMLLHNPGIWMDDGSAMIVGLSDEWPIINATKIEKMKSYYCSPEGRYTELLEKFDMKIKLLYGGEWINRWLRIYVNIEGPDGSLLVCGEEPSVGTVAKTTRMAVMEDGTRVNVTVSAWF